MTPFENALVSVLASGILTLAGVAGGFWWRSRRRRPWRG